MKTPDHILRIAQNIDMWLKGKYSYKANISDVIEIQSEVIYVPLEQRMIRIQWLNKIVHI